MHATTDVIVHADGSWGLLAGSVWVRLSDLDVLEQGDSLKSLIEHRVVDVVNEWPGRHDDDERP